MIKAVFMHTSSTPAGGNPNPAVGNIVVQFKDNYQRYLGGTFGVVSPASGSDVKIDNSAMTAGVAYIITTLGNATAAKWLAIGVPIGVTPAVGVSFIALTNGGAGNTLTSRVQTAATAGSTIPTIEIVGDPNTTIAPSPQSSAGIGGQIIIQCLAATNSSTTTLIPTNPANGSVMGLEFYFDDSSVLPGDGGA